MIRICYTKNGTVECMELNEAAAPAVTLAPLLQDAATSTLWIDMAAPGREESEAILRGLFQFHPLAVDDALNEVHVPKLDDWGDYLYLVIRGVDYEVSTQEVALPELDIFLGERYLITYHREPVAAVDRVWQIFQQDERLRRRGADYVLYRLVDELVTGYMLVVEEMERTLDEIEDEIFGRTTSTATLEKIFMLKRGVLQLRRMVGQQRDVLGRLARDELKAVEPDARPFFRDVYDHMIRLHDLVDNLRDLATGALDTYLSVVNNRMNDVMKTLTLFATLFMPLTFLTGFFGMNFFEPSFPLPLWTSPWAFVLALTVMVVGPVSMLLWMWRRGWL